MDVLEFLTEERVLHLNGDKAGAVVEHDGAGLGDADRRLGDDRVERVQLDGASPSSTDGVRGPRPTAPPVRRPAPSGSAAGTRAASVVRGAALDDRAVVRDPLGEVLDQVRRSARPAGAAARRPALDAGRAPRGPGRGSRRGLSSSIQASVGAPPPGAERLARGRAAGRGRRSTPRRRTATGDAGCRAGRAARPGRAGVRSRSAAAAPFIATASRFGSRPRWASTTWARRSTSTEGMSMRTGQTS